MKKKWSRVRSNGSRYFSWRLPRSDFKSKKKGSKCCKMKRLDDFKTGSKRRNASWLLEKPSYCKSKSRSSGNANYLKTLRLLFKSPQ